MKFTLTIDCDNAAFYDDPYTEDPRNAAPELYRIVSEQVAPALLNGKVDGTLRDINGNTVGHFELTEDETTTDDGTSGQDRESYSDDQDRKSYTTE